MSEISRGRCVPCNVVWTWRRGRRNVAGTKCPECGLQLVPTSQNVIAPTRDWHEPGRDVLVQPTRAQLRALQYLYAGNPLARRQGGWIGSGSFAVACSTVALLAKAGLVKVLRKKPQGTERPAPRCTITDRGRQLVRKFL